MKRILLVLKICSVVLSVIFALTATTNVITAENFSTISSVLGQKTFEKVSTGNDVGDTDYFKTDYSDIASLKNDGRALIEEIAAGGTVLLKNENSALPLDVEGGENKVCLFGIESLYDYTVFYGNSSAKTSKPDKGVSFEEAFTTAGLSTNSILSNFYKTYKTNFAPDYKNFQINDAAWNDINVSSSVSGSFATFGDAAVVVISRSGGEGADLPVSGTKSDGENGNYLALNDKEKSVLKGIADLKGETFKKIIVILNSANQIETQFVNDATYKIDACLWIGFPGQTGLNSVAKILTGEINPSGKLADTYWTAHAQNPAMFNFGASDYANYNASDFSNIVGNTGEVYFNKYVVYQEGIYVGYRYTETRYFDFVTSREGVGNFDYGEVVSYPFGFGLSYTSFDYSSFAKHYNAEKDEYTLSVTIKNIGERAGREVAQFYLSKPYTSTDVENGVEIAAVELVAYAKTRELSVNESQTLSVVVEGSQLASYDSNGAKTYVVGEGAHYFIAASNAHAAANNLLAKLGKSVSDGMTETGDGDLVVREEKSYNAEKYCITVSGATVTNLFDYADVNHYENKGKNKVTYLSRNNWQETMPVMGVSLSLNDAMVADLLAQNDGSSIAQDTSAYPTYGKDNGLSLIDLKNDADGNVIPTTDSRWDDLIDEMSWEDLCYLLTEGKRMTAIVTSIGKPATVDHNGPLGLTQPYSFGESGLATLYGDADANTCAPFYPCVGIIAATFDVELAQRTGQMFGEDALWAGYSGLYGVSMNIHRSAYDGRCAEYYSEDSLLSGEQAAAFTLGLQSKGCNAYIKHIAGYEQQACRIGISVWCNEQAYREIYLKPFKIASLKGCAMNAMTSYTRLGIKLCPTSYELCTDYLRNECNLKGLIVTDMWDNRYIDAMLPLCLMAGCDIPDGNRSTQGIFDDYQTGYANVAFQMRLAAKHVLYSTLHSNAMNGTGAGVKYVKITPPWQKAVIACTVASGTLFCVAWITFVAAVVVDKKKLKNKV